MRTLEYNWPYDWANRLMNSRLLCIDSESITPLVAIAVDDEGVWCPPERSLFYNGYIFLRLMLPCAIFVHLKWKADGRLQFGFGWKLNGRFSIILRYQSDASAARGVNGPNLGQAAAWARGTA